MKDVTGEEGNYPIASIVAAVGKPINGLWWGVFTVAWVVALCGLGWSGYQIAMEGVGVLGVNNSVPWGLDVVHFVFWIGLGHAGTLISAVLWLTRQSWRGPIARGAELMTLCAVICAAVFPIVHVGRIWMTWLASPMPEISGVWPDLASPILWDVMAVSTYFFLSLIYWYLGLIPDFAVLRDHCNGKRRRWYGLLALGWQGKAHQWRAFIGCNCIFAALLTALVVSVHSVVSYDFAVTQVADWHLSIFPPYFVVGAILSGLAMIQLILVCVRRFMKQFAIQEFLNKKVLDYSSRLLLCVALGMGCFYFWEQLSKLLSGTEWHSSTLIWLIFGLNVLVPQIYWIKKCRISRICMVLVSVAVLIGMWLERFWIIVGGLEASELPGAIGNYTASMVDWAMCLGSIGLFIGLYMGGARLTPFFSLCENYLTRKEHRHE